jgi:hypothetical protein
MSLLFTNNAVSTLASGISAVATSLTVQAADGLKYPNPSGNDSFLITLQDASNNIEIVECTSKSSDTFTIVRNREGTGAKAWLAGDVVELRVTAGVLSQYRQGVGDAVIDTAISIALGFNHAHDYINCTNGGITVSLADAATMAEGYQVTIKNSSSADITIGRATPGDTIDGVTADINISSGATRYFSVNANETGYITMFNGAAAALPVGSLFFAGVATNPAILLGFGTWAPIAGRFIVGVGDNGDGKTYANGAQGGDKDAVVVSHQHDPAGGHDHTVPFRVDPVGDSEGGNGDQRIQAVASPTSTEPDHQHPSEGVSGTDKNLPPYEGAYIWRRTA